MLCFSSGPENLHKGTQIYILRLPPALPGEVQLHPLLAAAEQGQGQGVSKTMGFLRDGELFRQGVAPDATEVEGGPGYACATAHLSICSSYTPSRAPKRRAIP